MMTRFLDVAELELEDTIRHYDNITPELGADFRREVNQALNRIEQMPFAWSRLRKDIRV